MSLRLTWTGAAERDLAKLDKQVAARVVQAVVRFAETGHSDLKHMQPPEYGHRIRVGDWRVLVNLDEPGTIVVRRIEHRSRVYKRR